MAGLRRLEKMIPNYLGLQRVLVTMLGARWFSGGAASMAISTLYKPNPITNGVAERR
jgi:hypothetical protein